MTSEQRIAEWVDRLDTGLIDTDSLALVRAALPDLIASVRAEAIEECARICDKAREEAEAEYKGDLDTSDFLAEAVMANWCASECRALVKERKGEE